LKHYLALRNYLLNGAAWDRLFLSLGRRLIGPPNKMRDHALAGFFTILRLIGRVGMWRGGSRFGLSVAAPFVWRCPSNLAVAPFPHPAHRTGRADLPHPALGQDFTPSPTTRRAQAWSAVRDRSARRGARVDRAHPCIA